MCYSITTPTSTFTTVFDVGNYTPLETAPSSTRWPLLIFSPSEAGVFPVLLFLHGYLLCNSFYSHLLRHIASHGFIVVAPQLYKWAWLDASREINTTVNIANWLPQGLGPLLPAQVEPNFNKLALAGHSRGGKDAFAVALMNRSSISLNISALIGVDPVDGTAIGGQTPPPVLNYRPHSFNLDGIPVLVIGSGLGEEWKYFIPPCPPCAPKGFNHEDFYNECKKPAYHFVAKDYGHDDMLDDNATGIQVWVCKQGKSREPMRGFVGGISVAFLKAHLEGDSTELVAIIRGQEKVPVEFKCSLNTNVIIGNTKCEEKSMKMST